MDFGALAERLFSLGIAALSTPFREGERIYWLYLATSGVIAAGVFRDSALRSQRSPSALLGYLLPRRVYLHPSARLDYAFFLVDRVLFALLVAPWFLGSGAAFLLTRQVLSMAVPEGVLGVAPTVPLVAGLTVLSFLAGDFGVFASHYLQHKVPLLWEFHKVHHSAEVLTPITVYRMHPVDKMFTMSITGLLTGCVHGAFVHLVSDRIPTFSVFSLNLGLFLFYLVGYNLRHSHVWLDYGPVLSRLLISPAQHQIHHSADPRHYDTNLGFVFAVWDWALGTLYVPQGREELRYGLADDEHKEFSSVWQLYIRPFRRCLTRGQSALRRSRARQAGLPLLLGLLSVVPLLGLEMCSSAGPQPELRLAELTWVEVQQHLDGGTTTIIVPTGGVEQNGPHLVLGKHNHVVQHTASEVARRLGDALVAPVVAYVPEGSVNPPELHMRWPGTISIPEPVFGAVLEATARSLKQHGFRTICFLGDSAGNQSEQARVAQQLTTEWTDEGVLVLHVGDYYSANGQIEWLLAEGETLASIGGHAGIRDTSELIAVSPWAVRFDRLRPGGSDGVHGDPTRASRARGRQMLELKISAGLAQIRAARHEVSRER